MAKDEIRAVLNANVGVVGATVDAVRNLRKSSLEEEQLRRKPTDINQNAASWCAPT